MSFFNGKLTGAKCCQVLREHFPQLKADRVFAFNQNQFNPTNNLLIYMFIFKSELLLRLNECYENGKKLVKAKKKKKYRINGFLESFFKPLFFPATLYVTFT